MGASIIEFSQYVIANPGAAVATLAAIVGGFAFVARFTPNKVDDKWVQKGLDLINWLGQNTGKAKNDPKA